MRALSLIQRIRISGHSVVASIFVVVSLSSSFASSHAFGQEGPSPTRIHVLATVPEGLYPTYGPFPGVSPFSRHVFGLIDSLDPECFGGRDVFIMRTDGALRGYGISYPAGLVVGKMQGSVDDLTSLFYAYVPERAPSTDSSARGCSAATSNYFGFGPYPGSPPSPEPSPEPSHSPPEPEPPPDPGPSPAPEPTEGPRPSPSPDPDFNEGSGGAIVIARSVSLDLHRHLRASGVVVAAPDHHGCFEGVIVSIQMSRMGEWTLVRATRTTAGGEFYLRLPDRKGTYRAVIEPTPSGSDAECAAASSSPERHRHRR